MEAAFAMASAVLGPDLDAVIVPRATLTLPIVGGNSFESVPSSVQGGQTAETSSSLEMYVEARRESRKLK
jgi:hypothetical protein